MTRKQGKSNAKARAEESIVILVHPVRVYEQIGSIMIYLCVSAILLIPMNNMNPLAAELSMTGSDKRKNSNTRMVICRTLVRGFHDLFDAFRQ